MNDAGLPIDRVHPLAAIFPMMSDDELLELADDIRANGLLFPIIRSTDGILVDGRNRLRACVIAGVEPTFDDCVTSDEQARAIILSANIARRHLSKGQQAMATAMLYPHGQQGHRSDLNGTSTSNLGKLSHEILRKARTIVNNAPDLAPIVLSGAMSLDTAYGMVKTRQGAAQSKEAKLAELRTGASDLADLVVEGQLDLDEAMAALRQRRAEQQQAIDAGKRAADRLFTSIIADAISIQSARELGANLAIPDLIDKLSDAIVLLRRAGEEPAP